MSDSGLLFKAFTLLHLLKPRGGYTEWGAAELSRQAGYNPGTTHRILQDMLKTGFVHQNPKTKKFHLGSAFIEFGFLARSLFSIREISRPIMEGLSIKTQESIYLNVIPNDQEALLIDSIDSTNQLRIVEPVGLLLPLHIGATRRVILANMELEQQERYIKETNLELRTPKTIVKESDLRAELIKIKEQGYAISFEETTLGTAGIAVALFGIDGVEGSLGIATPHIRLTEDVIPIYAKLLTEAADKISNALCGR